MWTSLLVFFISVGLKNGSCNETVISLNAIEELMQVKCIINSKSTNVTHQFQNALTGYVSCVVKTHKADAPHPVNKHQDYCKHLKEGEFRTCVRNFTHDLSPCLDETEAYLPQLILQSLNSSYERFCGTDGFSNTKYMYYTIKNESDCLVTAAGTYLGGGECLSNLTFFKNIERGILDLSRTNLCQDLVSIPKCVSHVLERQCNGNYSRFVDLLVKPFIEGCSNLLGKEYWIANEHLTNKSENN